MKHAIKKCMHTPKFADDKKISIGLCWNETWN